MQEIQTFQNTSADYSVEVTLDRQSVSLRIVWNVRVGIFFILFTDSQGNEIGFTKLTPQNLVLRPYKHLVNFKGDFLVLPVNNNAIGEIDYDTFGSDWGLFYLSETEVDEWILENGI